MRTEGYNRLIEKLDQFIRKFYMNQLIRGALYCTGIILGLFLLFNLLEYWFHFSTGGRKVLYYSFLGTSGLSLLALVFVPLLRYFRLGSVISHEQAAVIIGEHFANVKDKLLNILQLKQQADAEQTALLLAGINQKSDEIKLVPFKNAINLAQNKRYLWYALPPLLLLLLILFVNASLIKDSTARLINNDKEFARQAPFHFSVENKNLTVVQYSDFLLNVTVEGEVLPNEIFIDIDNYKYKLTPVGKNHFTYEFRNVQKETPFKLSASGFDSDGYQLAVLKKPSIVGFDLQLDYPAYTQRKDERLANIGDVVVPQGTQLSWLFETQNADGIRIEFAGQKAPQQAKRTGDASFSLGRRAMADQAYKIFISNANLPNADSIAYTITVVPDLHPTISVQQFADSLDNKMLYFVGDAADDYGLRSVGFHYNVIEEDGRQSPENNVPIVLAPQGTAVQYQHTWDVGKLNLKPGQKLNYYFEVFDNDAINGSKSARTNVMTFAVPSVEQFEQMQEDNNKDIKKDLDKAKQESEKIKQDMQKLREKLLQEKEVDWQTRKEIEKLLDRQKELQQQLEDSKDKFEENMKNQEQFDQPKDEILQKQEHIQKLFDELMSDEMKELIKKMEEMLQKLNQENAMEEMKKFELQDEELNKELDRMLEMFKQLEVEHEMQQQIDKLEELAEKEEKLSEETEQKKDAQENLENKQENINKEFDKVQEKMKEIEQKNDKLENKKDLEGMEEQLEDIDNDLEQSQEQLDQQQNSKASKSQKKAAQKMKQAAQKMQAQMQQGEMQQMEEDMAALRQLLENLVTLSFDQEGTMEEVSKTAINTPLYTKLVRQQYKIKDDFKLVEDSLHALSKRVTQIESFITEKVTDVKGNIATSIGQLEERQKQQATVAQQFAMKGLNDLALMLSEAMAQMQQQMASAMPGSQMCQKPGGAKPNKAGKGKTPGNLGQMQEELNKQMQQMREGMMKDGKNGMSKEYAQMAARQAAIRKALEKMQKEQQQQGKGGDKEVQKMIDQMDKTETELVNKQLNNQTMKRQQDILTRLLEHDKAQREEEYDEKRKAERATEQEHKAPPALQEYLKKREAEINMYKSVSPALKPYYKFLVEEYFKSLKTKQ
jgi:hypothetical protein